MIALTMSACGSVVPTFADDVPTQTYPLVSRVDPASGPVGTTMTIYGIGFSAAAPFNVVVIGGSSVAAESYEALANPIADEVERITATVPDDAVTGESSVLVVVHDNPSNADVLFEVTP